MNVKKKTVWKIFVWSMDSSLLDSLIKKLMELAKMNSISGSVACLPSKDRRFAILRSPFIYKKSMEHYKQKVRKKVIYFFPGKEASLDIFNSVIVSPGIQMEVKIG